MELLNLSNVYETYKIGFTERVDRNIESGYNRLTKRILFDYHEAL